MLIGYARTSTLEQEAGLEAQVRDLTALGCKKVFSEQVSSVGQRPELDAAIEYVREGDTLVVTKLDRLARSVTHMGELVARLEAKGVALRIVSLGVGEGGLDTATSTGKLMLNVLASVAQFEREMMLERQREGIAKAKLAGLYKGRKPTARAKADEVRALAADGMSMGGIAIKVGIGKGSVHRILSDSAGR
ncbi:recombinase family protein [Aureimonas sp. OT7]|uniref:recombinase family protein n=1 Tax=Aureimonas sp. OT7 TaxID=2816454 RepID=UPI0017854E88|nr:recombinase family protein [Aureimonas sp. OT7]QOG06404.1 recombinase family protein [Aureimonas sp. OT7]